METCCVTVAQGPRKGLLCQFPKTSDTNPYCGRHQRQKEYDELIKQGKNPCLNFFRACNATVDKQNTKCKPCLDSVRTKEFSCKSDTCKNYVVDKDTYCKKHTRQKYYDEEKEKGIKYCDIARGCFTLLDIEGKSSCDKCLKKDRINDNKRYKNNKTISKNLIVTNSDLRVCAQCSKDFNKYNTLHNVESVNCIECQEIQKSQDKKRVRVRNYKAEKKKNLKTYYKSYFNGAVKRNYEFLITFEEFTDLISKPCYYCEEVNIVNGIDRVDNIKGYTIDNCKPSCKMCNVMKLDHPFDKFIEKCIKIASVFS